MSTRISIKSKLGAEFRRFSLKKTFKFVEFKEKLEKVHSLFEIPFFVFYTDPNHGDLLPINNDDNFIRAISLEQPCLKLILQTKGECWIQSDGFGKKKNFFDNINNLLPTSAPDRNRKPLISYPEDFRQVSSIIDVDVLPETCRRVRLVKHGSDKPLGFYIRDGTSVRVTSKGLEKVPGIFISRLVPGGLAESTGLLAVSDEVLEVNGIEVLGKNLDQVTEMMVANSSNLIITIRPAGQRNPFQYPTKKSLQDQQLELNQKRYQASNNSLQNNNYTKLMQALAAKDGHDLIKNNQKVCIYKQTENGLVLDYAASDYSKASNKDDEDDEDEIKEHMNL